MKRDLQRLYDTGYRSIAIVLVHSYTFPEHENLVGRLAHEMGFTQVSESSRLLPMIKMVPRGVSSTADAYLTPILRDYLDGFFAGFDAKLKDGHTGSPRVEFMGSDGGLLDLRNFSGLKSILSGPAGGVVGYALTSWDERRKYPVIGQVFLFHLLLHTHLPHIQNRCRGNLDGCIAFRREVRSSLRDYYSWSHHPVTSTGYQHSCRWRRLLPDVPQWLVRSRSRERWGRTWTCLLSVC